MFRHADGVILAQIIQQPILLSLLAGIPIWRQRALAWIATPILELFGYRAVHKRFSGEER